MSFASQPVMALVRTTSSELAERLARLRRFEIACDQFREAGVSDEQNSMQWVLKFERSLIRSHCEATTEILRRES